MPTLDLKSLENMEVDLAKRDQYLAELEAQMYAKRFMLLQKRKALQNAVKQNHFLEDVKRDYDAYYNHIVQQKKDQMMAIEYLQTYVDNMISENKVSDSEIQKSKEQQESILRELQKIRVELEEIMKM
tara:strand:- start:4853 stop:5236 length:384 start_codon:yes stop_codon:yes gene_type:complete